MSKKVIFVKRKVADSKETERCTELGSADGSSSDGPEEYSMKMLIRSFWCSADRKFPMNQEEERKSEFYEDSDDSVVIF